VSRPRRSSL